MNTVATIPACLRHDEFQRFQWGCCGVERGVNTSLEIVPHLSSTVIGSRRVTFVGVIPTTLHDSAASGFDRRLGKVIRPNSHLPEELHLQIASRTHEFDVKRHVADVVPALSLATVLLNDGIHPATQRVLPDIKASVKRSTAPLPFNIVGDDEQTTRAFGFVFGINPMLRECNDCFTWFTPRGVEVPSRRFKVVLSTVIDRLQ